MKSEGFKKEKARTLSAFKSGATRHNPATNNATNTTTNALLTPNSDVNWNTVGQHLKYRVWIHSETRTCYDKNIQLKYSTSTGLEPRTT